MMRCVVVKSFILGRYPNPEIATLLIEHGANIGHKSRTGATALHGACLQGNKGE